MTHDEWEPDEEIVEIAAVWFDKTKPATRTILKMLRRARGVELYWRGPDQKETDIDDA